MGSLKNIASLFVKLDDEEPEEKQPQATAMVSAPTPPPPTLPTPAPPGATTDPQAEGKISEKLSLALEEGNLPGLDFFEFRKTLDALVGVIPDEATRYRAAFGSLVAQGAKADQILRTADHYLKVLDDKESGFAQYIAAQQETRVQSKLNEADGIKRQILEKGEQISKLTQEIGALTGTELAARNSATLAKAELETYQSSFKSIKERFTGEIQDIRGKIAQYVTNSPKT